jgi:hypothetical protein
MGKENLNMKMGIALKATISKIKREEKENTISMKAEYYNPNLTQTLLKYPKYI